MSSALSEEICGNLSKQSFVPFSGLKETAAELFLFCQDYLPASGPIGECSWGPFPVGRT